MRIVRPDPLLFALRVSVHEGQRSRLAKESSVAVADGAGGAVVRSWSTW